MFHKIDTEHWKRKDTYENFMALDCSYAITKTMDVTQSHAFLKASDHAFFPTFVWLLIHTVNQFPEFKMGLDEHGNPGYYDEIHAEYTLLLDEAAPFESIQTAYDASFPAFYHQMRKDIDRCKQTGVRPPCKENMALISCVPWFTYDSISFQVRDHRLFFRPMLVFGKYTLQKDRWTLPLTLQMHHACAYGYHCGLFFEALQNELDTLQQLRCSH